MENDGSICPQKNVQICSFLGIVELFATVEVRMMIHGHKKTCVQNQHDPTNHDKNGRVKKLNNPWPFLIHDLQRSV
jgi:hypothetical protein